MGSTALNAGDRKFSTSQNLTGRDVRRDTESIMIFMKRSYKCPDASEKTWTVLLASPAAAPPSAPSRPKKPDTLAQRESSPPSWPSPASSGTFSRPRCLRTGRNTEAPAKERTTTRRCCTGSEYAAASEGREGTPFHASSTSTTPDSARPARRAACTCSSVSSSENRAAPRPGASCRSHTPGAACSW